MYVVCISVYLYIRYYVCMCVCVHVRICICIFIICTCICICICKCIYIYIYIHTYTHTHDTYIHACIYTHIFITLTQTQFCTLGGGYCQYLTVISGRDSVCTQDSDCTTAGRDKFKACCSSFVRIFTAQCANIKDNELAGLEETFKAMGMCTSRGPDMNCKDYNFIIPFDLEDSGLIWLIYALAGFLVCICILAVCIRRLSAARAARARSNIEMVSPAVKL